MKFAALLLRSSHDGLDDGPDGCTLRLAEAGVLWEAGLVRLRIRLDHFLDRGQRSMV